MVFGDALQGGGNASYEEGISIQYKVISLCTCTLDHGRDSSVGIATRYGLIGLGIKFR
jgi:hypothetical protein